jgi:hypothetical protein
LSGWRLPGEGVAFPSWIATNVREVVVRRYRIVYQLAPDGIVVLVVFESPGGFRVALAGSTRKIGRPWVTVLRRTCRDGS